MRLSASTFAVALISGLAPVKGVQAQETADSVRVQVEAAVALLHGDRSPRTLWLDPRPELLASALDSLTFEALHRSGFQVYREPGIPTSGVGLLSSGAFRSGEDGSELWMRVTYFGSRTTFLNVYSYRYIFQVTCTGKGCVLGEELTPFHGDGHVSDDCWDDYFGRTAEERRDCRKARSVGATAHNKRVAPTPLLRLRRNRHLEAKAVGSGAR